MSDVRIVAAALTVTGTCGEALADKAGSFTCDEAEAINILFTECGEVYWAEEFRRAHAMGDDEESDLHHNGWVDPCPTGDCGHARSLHTPEHGCWADDCMCEARP